MNEALSNWLKDNRFKINSPVIGAFISSWILFNWDRFLLLFWGEGKLVARLKYFQESTNFSDNEFFWYPLALALIYVFLLPYVNTLTQFLLGHASKWSHEVAVNIDIEKEKRLVSLNEQKYKSNPDNEYLGKKLKYELENLEAETKKAQEDAERAASEARSEKTRAENAQAEAEKLKNEEDTARNNYKKSQLELAKQQRKSEKETLSHEAAKATHQHRISCLKFPLIYQFIEALSDQLSDNQVVVKVDTLSKVIAITFGYKNPEALFNDENFNQENLENLAFVIYDSKKLLHELMLIATSECIDELDENLLFDCVIETFNEMDYCKLLSDDAFEEEASIFIQENSYDIFNFDEVTSAMAETNAFFEEVNIYEAEEMNLDFEANLFEFIFSGTISGTSHEDKMFCGDTLDVSFTLRYPVTLGNRGLGEPKFEGIQASVSHPNDHGVT